MRDAEARGRVARRIGVDRPDVGVGFRAPQRGIEGRRRERCGHVVRAAGSLELGGEIGPQGVHHVRSGDAFRGVVDLQIGHPGDDVEGGGRGAGRVVRAAEQNQPEQPFEIGRDDRIAREALDGTGDRRHLGRQVRAPQVQLEEVQPVGGIAAIGQSGDLSERDVVLVDGRHQRIRAHPRTEIEIDPLEQIARMKRLDERHQLDGADLQRHARQRGGVGKHLRALAAVGRNLLRRGAAVLLGRGIGAQVGGVEQLAPPLLVHLGAAQRPAAGRRLRTPAGRSPRPPPAARLSDRGGADPGHRPRPRHRSSAPARSTREAIGPSTAS